LALAFRDPNRIAQITEAFGAFQRLNVDSFELYERNVEVKRKTAVQNFAHIFDDPLGTKVMFRAGTHQVTHRSASSDASWRARASGPYALRCVRPQSPFHFFRRAASFSS